MECQRGENYKLFSRIAGKGIFAACWILILVDMVAIVWTVRARLLQYSSENELRRTKQSARQARRFIGSFFVTYIVAVLIQVLPVEENNDNRTYYFCHGTPGQIFHALAGLLEYAHLLWYTTLRIDGNVSSVIKERVGHVSACSKSDFELA